MDNDIRLLAEKAGFILWGSEEWKSEGAIIDWSSDYTKEFDRFVKLHEEYVINKVLRDRHGLHL